MPKLVGRLPVCCGSRRVLHHFDWERKPSCVSQLNWDLLRSFWRGEPYKELALELKCSTQAVAHKVRTTIERTHAAAHPHHTMYCQSCKKARV